MERPLDPYQPWNVCLCGRPPAGKQPRATASRAAAARARPDPRPASRGRDRRRSTKSPARRGSFGRRRIKDRDPAKAQPTRPRRQPQRVHCDDRRIAQGLRHGLAPEAEPLPRRLIAEDGEMDRRFLKAGGASATHKAPRARRDIRASASALAVLIIGDDRGAPFRRDDVDETATAASCRPRARGRPDRADDPPPPAAPDRCEVPHVAPPGQQLGELGLERMAEAAMSRRRRRAIEREQRFGHQAAFGSAGFDEDRRSPSMMVLRS